MDVNELLRMILQDAEDLREHGTSLPPRRFTDHAMSLAENIINLDEWLRNGGFLPSAWVDATIAEADRHRSAED